MKTKPLTPEQELAIVNRVPKPQTSKERWPPKTTIPDPPIKTVGSDWPLSCTYPAIWICLAILIVMGLCALLATKAHAQQTLIKGDTLVCQTDTLYVLPPTVLRERLLRDKREIAGLKSLLSQKSLNTKSVIGWYDREIAVLRDQIGAYEKRVGDSDSLLSLCLTAQNGTADAIDRQLSGISGEVFELRVRYEQAEIDRQKEQVAAKKLARRKFWTGVGVGAGGAILGGIILIFAL